MTTWYCPTCGGPNELSASQNTLQCSYCEMRIGPQAVACLGCGQVWPNEFDNCPQCDDPLSTVGRIFERHEVAGGPPPWLERSRQQAGSVKTKAMAASEARMKEYVAIEQQRIAQIKQSEAEQRSSEQRLFLYMLGLAAGIFIIIVLVALLTAF